MQSQRLVRQVRSRHQRELTQGNITPLLELLDRCLDKGVLIEGHVCVPVLGVELLTLDCRAFVASCERYLEYAAAVAQTAGIRGRDDREHEHL